MKVHIIATSPKSQSSSVNMRLKDLTELIERPDVWVTADNVECPEAGDSLVNIVIGEIRTHWKVVKKLLSDNADVILWKGRISSLLIPLLVAKLDRRKSVLLIEGIGSVLVKEVYKGLLGKVLSIPYHIMESIAFSLVNKLAVNVPGLIKLLPRNKAFPEPISARTISDKFQMMNPIANRDVIGYVGRMTKEKGILNLVDAIHLIDSHFMLIGDGPLLETVKHKVNGRAEVCGWVEHDELASHLNEMRLLVIPSEYEGLPTVMLEAMACGVPVLATSVGAIPDLINDGENGFVMPNNEPACIAENIKRALHHASVSWNAHSWVTANYDKETMRGRWQKLLTKLS